MTEEIADPVERIVASGLQAAGIRFSRDPSTDPLDFYLPDFDVHVECKQFASDRTAGQLSRADNVILIQGRKAAELFASILSRSPRESDVSG